MEKNAQTMLATVGGAVLLLVGIIGLFNAPVLGIFGVNTLHNVIHLVAGLIGVWAGVWGGMNASTMFNKVFGIVYLLVAILGFAGIGVSLLDLNTADNILHLLIGVVFGGVGFFA